MGHPKRVFGRGGNPGSYPLHNSRAESPRPDARPTGADARHGRAAAHGRGRIEALSFSCTTAKSNVFEPSARTVAVSVLSTLNRAGM